MTIKFEFLEHGDCTIVTTDEFTMMIDGGHKHPFRAPQFKGTAPKVDSVVVTHIDRDHIGGVIECFKDKAILSNLKHIMFNEPESFKEFKSSEKTTQVSKKDGNLLNTVIKANPSITHWANLCVATNQTTLLDQSITGITKFTLLSPSKEQLAKLCNDWSKTLYNKSTQRFGKASDTRSVSELLSDKEEYRDSSVPNGSSLAFLIEHKSSKFLILGDAHVAQIVKQLKSMGYENKDGKRLVLDFIKLSHHGSKKSTSPELLGLIETENYVISKPSALQSKNPDRETIARIAAFGNGRVKRVLINDQKAGNLNFTQDEMQELSFSIQPTNSFSFEYK